MKWLMCVTIILQKHSQLKYDKWREVLSSQPKLNSRLVPTFWPELPGWNVGTRLYHVQFWLIAKNLYSCFTIHFKLLVLLIILNFFHVNNMMQSSPGFGVIMIANSSWSHLIHHRMNITALKPISCRLSLKGPSFELSEFRTSHSGEDILIVQREWLNLITTWSMRKYSSMELEQLLQRRSTRDHAALTWHSVMTACGEKETTLPSMLHTLVTMPIKKGDTVSCWWPTF